MVTLTDLKEALKTLIPPGLVPGDVTNPAKMREELRREAIEGYTTRIFAPSDADSDMACVYPLGYDEIIYSNIIDAGSIVARRNLLTGVDSWRITGYAAPASIDYDDVNQRVLVSYIGGVYIANAITGNIIQIIINLTDTGGVPRNLAGQLISEAIWDPADLNYIYLAETGANVVLRLNINTLQASHMFGTWGVAGTDFAHLSNPRGVEVNPPDGNLFICDMNNGRILRLDPATFVVKNLMLLWRPHTMRVARWGVTTQHRYPTVFSSGPGDPVPNECAAYTFGQNRTRHLLFSLPFQMEWPRWNPDFNRFWGQHIISQEVDLRRVTGKFIAKPDAFTLVNYAAVADAGWTSSPIPAILLGKMMIEIYSSQTGIFTIQVPDRNDFYGCGLWVPTTFNWVTYDDETIPSGGNISRWELSSPPPVFRMNFDPSGDAANVLVRLRMFGGMC